MRKTAPGSREIIYDDPLEETPLQGIITISFIILLLAFSGVLFYFVLHAQ